MSCLLTLLDCLREYDPTKGTDFQTYAHHLSEIPFNLPDAGGGRSFETMDAV